VQTFASSQVQPRLFEVGNPILGQHISRCSLTNEIYNCCRLSGMLMYVPSLSNHWLWASSSRNALSISFIFSIYLSTDWHCECMLFHSWLQHAMTTSVTYACFLSCSSSLSFSSFSAPVVSLLQFSLKWLSGSGISFLLKSVLAHPFLMQSINPSLVWFSVINPAVS